MEQHNAVEIIESSDAVNDFAIYEDELVFWMGARGNRESKRKVVENLQKTGYIVSHENTNNGWEKYSVK